MFSSSKTLRRLRRNGSQENRPEVLNISAPPPYVLIHEPQNCSSGYIRDFEGGGVQQFSKRGISLLKPLTTTRF